MIPKISIIIPAYNSAAYLPACLDSCLSQTFTDYEIVVINDGSTDNTVQLVANYMSKSNAIRLVNKKNEGLVMARRTYITEALADLIFFFDADDVIEPDSLELLYEQIEGADVVIGNLIVEHEDGTPFKYQKKNEFRYGTDTNGMVCNYLAKTISHAMWGRLFRKSVLVGIESPVDITVGEDAVTNYLICQSGTWL